jgi:hypothetical protein
MTSDPPGPAMSFRKWTPGLLNRSISAWVSTLMIIRPPRAGLGFASVIHRLCGTSGTIQGAKDEVHIVTAQQCKIRRIFHLGLKTEVFGVKLHGRLSVSSTMYRLPNMFTNPSYKLYALATE